ncbi:hypothetical protein BCR36DRAFT_579422 [Piromyces finnis]|uniref:Tetraspanin Tsp2 n=1 Tax=Piromyces finnis TaxID=1754191 RepID=A0A1Y1VM33_9FUNG|nr:hypothetical protein BCR36DRAFT_579422 [Piromyces finnis]|eukprot:ORX59968.1 hypothetical protein BCR36DRAFT_579422 [Piromyces finnis]
MSYQHNNYVSEIDLTRANNQEITIDCENYSSNGGNIHVNNGSSNMTSSHRRNQSGVSGLANSSSAPTLFESTADNSSFKVVRSYREYAANFVTSDDSISSNSDITGAVDGVSIDDKNTYDAYESKNIIDYDINKSKTVKSTSTSSSRTAYKNPTLLSVVNQTLVNTNFEKNYAVDSLYDDEDEIKKIKEENRKKIDTQLKLQKMILKVPETYDIPTRNKKIISQRILNLTLVLMIVIATTLIALYIYLKLNHGYSFPHIKDINDGNRTKMIFIGLFMYLAVIIGSVGSALNWKSILVTYCVFCSLNALALGYLVYGIYDDAYNYSNLPFAWWDTYSSTTRRTIQDQFSCCGFKQPLDGGEVSNYCPKEAVVWNIPYETIYDNFYIWKKDAVSKEMNATVVGKSNPVVLPTPVLDQVPTPTMDTNTPDLVNNDNVEGTTTTTAQQNQDDYSSRPENTEEPSSSHTQDETSTQDNSTVIVDDTNDNGETRVNDETEDNTNDDTNISKRSFEIEVKAMKILDSPVRVNNIYNILSANEIEEENDGRDDKEIARIRVLNKRTYERESFEHYQMRTNGGVVNTNPIENIQNSNFTGLTPEESKMFAKTNNIEGCEEKIKPFIHKNLVPIFYVLLVFFCLYIITIPTALVFLFKLRTIPSINEFE